jgi:hypothetical protein
LWHNHSSETLERLPEFPKPTPNLDFFGMFKKLLRQLPISTPNFPALGKNEISELEEAKKMLLEEAKKKVNWRIPDIILSSILSYKSET